MTVTGAAAPHPDVGTSSRASRRAWLVSALVLVAVVASVGLWQWRSPDAFAEGDVEIGVYNEVGTTALVGIAMPGRERVESAWPEVGWSGTASLMNNPTELGWATTTIDPSRSFQ